jgi:hypothetical protein
VALPQTDAAIGVRQTPNYGIWAADKDGILHADMLPPPNAKQGWPFDFDAAHAKAIADVNAARGSLMPTPAGPGQSKFNTIMGGISDAVKRGGGLTLEAPANEPAASSGNVIQLPRQGDQRGMHVR